MKKLLYIANSRIPTERAHGIQIMKMCEAFSHAGYAVELVIPNRRNHIKKDPFSYYRVENVFTIRKVPSIDLVHLGKIGFLIQSFTFGVSAALYARKKDFDVIYSRDENSLFVLSFFTHNFYIEVHDNRYNFLIKRVTSAARGVVSITEGLKRFYVEKGISKEKCFVAPDGVSLKDFNLSISKQDARARLNLPLHGRMVVYTGHLYVWKGIDVLADAVEKLPSDTVVYFVGGTDEDILSFKERNKSNQRLKLAGYRPYSEIPVWQAAADILVLPNTGHHNVSRYYTSPIKLFEYMASGRPIVASNISSITEILNESNAVLVKPDDAGDLARGIIDVLENEQEAKVRVEKAAKDVQAYTWSKRALNILDYISRKN